MDHCLCRPPTQTIRPLVSCSRKFIAANGKPFRIHDTSSGSETGLGPEASSGWFVGWSAESFVIGLTHG